MYMYIIGSHWHLEMCSKYCNGVKDIGLLGVCGISG